MKSDFERLTHQVAYLPRHDGLKRFSVLPKLEIVSSRIKAAVAWDSKLGYSTLEHLF